MSNRPTLHDYETGEVIRRATAAELKASKEAAFRDGGAGVITVVLTLKESNRVNEQRERYCIRAVVDMTAECYAME
jgi:hypothetical protein